MRNDLLDLAWLHALQTPCLVLDESALKHNLERMSEIMVEHKVDLRPHGKTHRCAEIAKKQIRSGAVGIACATLQEASFFASSGIDGLLLTSSIGEGVCRNRTGDQSGLSNRCGSS